MAVQVFIDGTELDTPSGGIYALTGSVTRKLNSPAEATINVPMTFAIGGAGSRLKIVIEGDIWFHGFVQSCETDTGEDFGYTVYNARDVSEIWDWRPVRADDGDFSKPSGSGAVDGSDIIATYDTGPQIVEAVLNNSEDTTPGGGSSDDADCEGPLFLEFGTFEAGGQSMSGAPVDWPMTITEFFQLLISTGELDIVITPIDSGGNMGRVDAYNGFYGLNLTGEDIEIPNGPTIPPDGEVRLSYGMGDHNIARLRWHEDMSQMTNKLWYFFGPRVKTWNDPEGEQHWCFNVQGDDQGLPDPPATDVIARRDQSRIDFGVRMEIQIYDGVSEDCNPLADQLTANFRALWRLSWITEQWIRAYPRELVHVQPIRGSGLVGAFDIGDIIVVECTSDVRGGFSAAQRVYGYTVSWDNDGVYEISEILTSSDQEGGVRGGS